MQQAEKDRVALLQQGSQFTERFLTQQERQAELMQQADRLVKPLNDSTLAGAISWDTYGRAATKALTDSMEKLDKQVEALPKLAKPLEQMSQFAEQAARNIQDALGDSLEQLLAGNFNSIGKLWEDMLRKMVAQAAALQINDFLFGGSFGQKGGGMGGAVGDLFSLFRPGFSGFFATGGTLGAGQWGIAGERGPEVVQGPARITPMGAGGPTVTYAPQFNVNGDVSPQTINAMRAVARSEFTRLARQLNLGTA